MNKPIYLDYAATTPLDKEILEKMMPYLTEDYGNASNTLHSYGKKANNAIEHARKQIATALGVDTSEIIFTSGATESINIVLKGVFSKYQNKGKHYVTCVTEHPAVRKTFQLLESQGAEVTYLDVDENGNLSLEEFEHALREDTVMACIMGVNNEIGTVHPIEKISAICKAKGVLMMTDGTQSLGKVNCHIPTIGVDVFVGSAHKVYGPKGIGFIYVKRKNPRVVFDPLIQGGSQEDNKRSGTYNVPAIVGMGEAVKMAVEKQNEEAKRIRTLSDYFKMELKQRFQAEIIEGNEYVPHIINVAFPGASNTFVRPLANDVAFSVGAACSSSANKGSYVLQKCGRSDELIKKSIRFCIGKYTQKDDICQVLTQINTRIAAEM